MMVCVPSLLSWRAPNLVIEETVDADLEAKPATVSRSRSLSQSRDSQDLAGPAPRGRRQAGPGGAYRAHCIDLPYRGRALIACAHASAAPAYFTVPPWQERTPHSSEGWLAR